MANRLNLEDVGQLQQVNSNSFQLNAKVLQSVLGQRQETSRSPAARFSSQYNKI